MKSHADDFYQLAKQLGCESIVVGGHDWYNSSRGLQSLLELITDDFAGAQLSPGDLHCIIQHL